MYSVMVFSRTRHGADKINRRLKKAGIKSVAIHSDRTQSQRLQAMDGFRQGKFQVIVATDIAARGINIEGVSHVINFDVPAFPEDYIHRIGRTGRAEALGDAITFVSYDEQKSLRKIERFIGQDLNTEEFEGFAYKKSDTLEPIPVNKPRQAKKPKLSDNVGKKPRLSGRRRRRSIKRR